MSDAFAANLVIRALGWALLQSVWQGVLLGAITAIVLIALRNSTASRRYVVSCASLLLFALVFVATAVLTARDIADRAPASVVSVASSMAVSPASGMGVADPRSVVRGAPASFSARAWWTRERLQAVGAVMVPLWLAGVLLLSARLLAGWVVVERIRRSASLGLPPGWQHRLDAMCSVFQVHRRMRLVQSGMVAVPTVIGWIRPVILLPASALSGLTVEQLEAVIAHELAHVRRHDYVINLLQSTIEVLLFYHPVTWWMTRQIRIEREHCCDDEAAAYCGDRLLYASALAELEALRGPAPVFGLAATDGVLLNRVRRLLGVPAAGTASSPTWLLAGVVAIAVALAVTGEAADGKASRAPQAGTTRTDAGVPPDEGVVRGRVFDEVSGQPIADASIVMFADPRTSDRSRRAGRVYRLDAAADGRFEITAASPGDYLVSANAPGYVLTYFGQTSGNQRGVPIRVIGGRVTSGIDMRLPSSGAVSGRILSDSGEGLPGVEVELVREMRSQGEPPAAAIGFAQTEAGGRFRIADVLPGEYYLRAYAPSSIRPARAGELAYAPTFYPDSTRIDGAQRVLVAGGQEVFDLDFSLAAVGPRVVRGRLVDADGPALSSAVVMLWSASQGAHSEGPRAAVASDGRFELRGVVPGEYMLRINDPADYRRWLGSMRQIVVEDDVTDLEITAQRLTRIDGRVIGEAGKRVPFDRGDIRILLEHRVAGPGNMMSGIGAGGRGVGPDGTFWIEAPQGRSILQISNLPPRWIVRSARLDGVNVMDSSFELTGTHRSLEVVVTDRAAGVAGTVTDDESQPVGSAAVILFPEQSALRSASRLVRSVFSTQEGLYQIDDLPPGDYRAVALPSAPEEPSREVGLLERLVPMSTPLRLRDGERATLALKLAGGKR